MKHSVILFTVISILIAPTVTLADTKIADPWNIKLAVYTDGKKAEQSMIVEVTVWQTADGYRVTWDMVNIITQDGKLVLRPIHWSSDNGMIENVRVHSADALSFDILTLTRTIKIVCTKNKDGKWIVDPLDGTVC